LPIGQIGPTGQNFISSSSCSGGRAASAGLLTLARVKAADAQARGYNWKQRHVRERKMIYRGLDGYDGRGRDIE